MSFYENLKKRITLDDRCAIIAPRFYWPKKFACGHYGPLTFSHEIEGETTELTGWWNGKDVDCAF